MWERSDVVGGEATFVVGASEALLVYLREDEGDQGPKRS